MLFIVDIELDRFVRLVNLRTDPAPMRCVGVELVTSLKGDFSSLRNGLNNSISARKRRGYINNSTTRDTVSDVDGRPEVL